MSASVARQIPEAATIDHPETGRGASAPRPSATVCRCRAYISLSSLSFGLLDLKLTDFVDLESADLVHLELAHSVERTHTLAATPIQAARDRLNTTADNMMNTPHAHNSRTTPADRRDSEYNS